MAAGANYPPYPYGPPQGQYGQPPPQGQYGQMPSPGQYGQMSPQGQYGPMPMPPMPWQYRPMQPDNARGMPPTPIPTPAPAAAQPSAQAPAQPPAYPSGSRTGLQPGYGPGYQQGWQGAPGYAQRPPATDSSPPRLEWSLDETRPYVQQTLVLRLRLVSQQGVDTAEPEIPPSSDVLIQRLGDMTSAYRNGDGGQRELVTGFVFTLTPLRTGTLELPRFEVNGTRSGGYGGAARYQAIADDPVRLQIRPAMASVRPWLPLKSLSIKSTIDHADQVQAGQPVTLALELSAVGGGAGELPSLEDQLKSPDFRVYREQTLSDTRLAQDGREIEGKRTEYYTLVPQTGGNLRLPEIAVPWWNVDEDAKRIARLPIRTLEIEGVSGPFGWPASLSGAASDWGPVWVPFAAVILVLAGYWGAVLRWRRVPGKGPALGATLRSGLGQAAGLARRGAVVAVRRLRPASLAARLRTAATALLPESSRLLRCVRRANRAATPAAWCERFEQSARLWLRSPGQSSVLSMTERILALRPHADRARVTRLMEQLDSALYGRQDIDFPRWKRELMRQVGRLPSLLRPRRGETRIRRARLPALNPRPA